MKFPEWLKTTLSIIVVGFVLLTPFVFNKNTKTEAPFFAPIFSHELKIGTNELLVAYANSDSSREQGLSFTKSINENQGMLFMFNEPTLPDFWMKDMNYPLDIIWIDENKKVVGAEENVYPNTYPKTFSPELNIKYALEVNAGFYTKNNITIGAEVDF